MLVKNLKNKEKIMKRLAIISILCLSLVGCSSAPDPITVVIKPIGNEMKYETTQFEVLKGQEVTIIMDNIATEEMMKHNVVVLNDESKVNEVGMAAMSAPGYIPENEAIIAATAIAEAGQQTRITFTAPKKTGTYVYICTFPGHFSMMRGEMIVK
ncbi:hypothetical protein DID80_06665 [Candidatus Marinamargulisbacteria bacterium SCGC AAA071-K20]|nr:hypothetical protein DID80_06665 [Candidatus Marinamargulisbacteria bacterium SCGC AAA071-K20]